MDIDALLERLGRYAPEATALPGDPVGLQISPRDEEVTRVVVCLDATHEVVAAAAELGAELIVAHHPLIYHPMKRIDRAERAGSIVATLIERGIGCYAMHTNWDAAPGGVNDTLASLIGLRDTRTLEHRHSAPEAKLGRIGELAGPLAVPAFLAQVEAALRGAGASALRHNLAGMNGRADDGIVARIAVCGGAGAALAADALALDADALITADVRHHEFIEAAARNLLLVDAGHEATEAPGMRALAERLAADEPGLTVGFLPNAGE